MQIKRRTGRAGSAGLAGRTGQAGFVGRAGRTGVAVAVVVLLGAGGCAENRPEPGAAMSPQARGYLTTALDLMEKNFLRKAGVDWPAVRREAFERAGKAAAPPDTYGAIRQALRDLGDRHSVFQEPAEAAAAAIAEGDAFTPPEGRLLPGRVGYLTLPSNPSDEAGARYVREGRAVVGRLDGQGACGWVVDLRVNRGGDMFGPLAVVGRILGDGDAGAFVTPDGKRTAWTIRQGTPAEYLARWGGVRPPARPMPPVAVLTDRRTVSAGEAVAIAFRGRPATRTFGLPTAGLPTANAAHRLPDGAMIVLPGAWEADRTGRIHDGPLIPDEEIAVDGEDFGSAQDRALTAATRWLGAQPGCR